MSASARSRTTEPQFGHTSESRNHSESAAKVCRVSQQGQNPSCAYRNAIRRHPHRRLTNARAPGKSEIEIFRSLAKALFNKAALFKPKNFKPPARAGAAEPAMAPLARR